jgi:hypothetical protein
MVIQAMDADACRELLARVGFGRLACAKDNQPYVVPVYFACEGERIYGFSVVGKKIEWMRANPKVCLEVDEVKGQFEWKSVVVTGRYEELGEGSEFSAARAVVERSMQRRYMAWETPYQILHRREPGASGPAVFYSICVEDMTGLSATSEPFEPAAPF